ncbi:MAG: CsbD family protein [Solirubrobacteraceae bacterium]|jgi:uncharacterized protein YjbJ (UPF0337 family)
MTAKNVDEVKGRVKRAAGVLTGDASLEREGRVDQARQTIKDAVDKILDRIPTSRPNKK